MNLLLERRKEIELQIAALQQRLNVLNKSIHILRIEKSDDSTTVS